MGSNKIFGGYGNDLLRFHPGIDAQATGGPGDVDTLQLHFSACPALDQVQEDPKALNPGPASRQRIYVDLSRQSREEGRGGIALGALLRGIHMLDRRVLASHMHIPAFVHESALSNEVIALFRTNSTQLSSADTVPMRKKLLWYLADDGNYKYLTDGHYFYRHSNDEQGNASLLRAAFTMDDVDVSQAVYNESVGYMQYKDNLFMALLTFAFKKTTRVDGIERVVVTPGGNVGVPHCQVVADPFVQMIDLYKGHNGYTYVNNGSSTVIFSGGNSREFQIVQYIEADKPSTLIINGDRRDTYRNNRRGDTNQYVLLDHDVLVSEVNRKPNLCNDKVWSENRVDRAVFVKNMETIIFGSDVEDSYDFLIDAVNLSTGHRFIVNTFSDFFFVGTQGDDYVALQQIGERGSVDAQQGLNMLSMADWRGTNPIRIQLGNKSNPIGLLTGESLSVELLNFQTVQGNTYTTEIVGHEVEDNLLISNGGECTVKSRGGNNTMITMRGTHTLVGGSGQDSYELYGPITSEFVVVRIMKSKTNTVTASATNGVWENGKLTVSVLTGEHPFLHIVQDSIQIDHSGIKADTTTLAQNVGSVTAFGDKLAYTVGTWFDTLRRGRSVTIRIKFKVRGSTTRIRESSMGNRLKLHNFANKSELEVSIDSDFNLQFTTLSNWLVFKDMFWGDLYRSGVTSLEMLVGNFVMRFPVVQFNGKDADNAWLKEKQISDFLMEKLSSYRKPKICIRGGLECESSNIFNSIKEVMTTTADLFLTGPGTDVLLCRRRNVTYRSGTGNAIFDLTRVGTGSTGNCSVTKVDSATGNVLIAISADPAECVNIRFKARNAEVKTGNRIMVIKGAHPTTVSTEKVASDELPWKFKSGQGEAPFVEMDSLPDLLMFSDVVEEKFKSIQKSFLIDDVSNFFDTKLEGGTFHPRHVFNEKFEEQLDLRHLPEPYEFSLEVDIGISAVTVALMEKNDELCRCRALTRVPNAVKIAEAFQARFLQGIQLKDMLYKTDLIRYLIMKCFQEGNYVYPSVKRGTMQTDIAFIYTPDTGKIQHFFYSSKEKPTYHVSKPGDAVIYADRKGGKIYGGAGNNIVKVMSSGTTVGTGACSEDSQCIVEIYSGVRNTTISMSSRTSVVINDVSPTEVKCTDPAGNTLDENYEREQPFVMKSGEEVIARFNHLPFGLFFYSNEQYFVYYEKWVYEHVLSFCRSSRFYRAPWVVNANRDVMVDYSNHQWMSDKFYVTQYRAGNTIGFLNPVRYTDNDLYHLGVQYSVERQHCTMTSKAAAAHVATCFPGGVRFKDRFVTPDELEDFLRISLETVKYVYILDTEYKEPIPSESTNMRELLRKHNPQQFILDVVDAVRVSLPITHVDPEGVVGGKTGQSFIIANGKISQRPILMTTATYPSLTAGLEHHRVKKAVTWKGLTYFPFKGNPMNMLAWDDDKGTWLSSYYTTYNGGFEDMSLRQNNLLFVVGGLEYVIPFHLLWWN